MSTKHPITTLDPQLHKERITDTTPPAKGACREDSEDFFEATDEYDAYDDFEIGSGASGGGSSSNKTEKRANIRGQSGNQGPYSAKHNRLRAERPKTQPK